MPDTPPSAPRPRVVIAGGGIAGIEAVLALRAFAPDLLDVLVIDPGRHFRIPSTAMGRAFGIGPQGDVPLAELVERAGAEFRRARLVAVDADRRTAMLAGGELVVFDHLLVAVGARREPYLSEALAFRGHEDADAVLPLVDDLVGRASRGARRTLAVVVPPGVEWSLAAYELALLARRHLWSAGIGRIVRVVVVTAEPAPLAVFGQEATAGVRSILRRSDIELVCGAEVTDWRWGRLDLAVGEPLAADRVICLPVLRGPAIEGLPADARGFHRTSADGAVPGRPGVWVIGDGGSFPLKQGGIACQQADAAAASIARAAGALIEPIPFRPVVFGWIWDGAVGRMMRARLGEALFGVDEGRGLGPPSPEDKVSGRFLTPFLHALGEERERIEAGVPAS